MEEDIKNMSKEELLEYLEDISKQLNNIALDQIPIAISELQFFKERYKELKEENNQLKLKIRDLYKSKGEHLKAKTIMTSKLREYIPISVIQNKIDELSNNEEDYQYIISKTNRIIYKIDIIDILQELLEERNK